MRYPWTHQVHSDGIQIFEFNSFIWAYPRTWYILFWKFVGTVTWIYIKNRASSNPCPLKFSACRKMIIWKEANLRCGTLGWTVTVASVSDRGRDYDRVLGPRLIWKFSLLLLNVNFTIWNFRRARFCNFNEYRYTCMKIQVKIRCWFNSTIRIFTSLTGQCYLE